MPTIQNLIKISDYLNCPTDYLLTGKEPRSAPSLSDQELISLPSMPKSNIFTEKEKLEKGKKFFEIAEEYKMTLPNDYVVIDLETCGLNRIDRKQIIEISALRFRSGELADTFSTLVNPGISIPYSATQVNHITDEMVKTAPLLQDIFSDFVDFIGNDALVGHNIAAYDYPIICELAEELCNKTISNPHIDTYKLARYCLPELQNHRLETLIQYLGLSTDQMHRSYEDCLLTQELYTALKPLCGKRISPKYHSDKTKKSQKYGYAQIDESVFINNPFYDKICIVYGAFQQLSTDQIKKLFGVLGAHYVDFSCYSADFLILGEEMYRKYLIQDGKDEIINNCVKLKIPILSEYDFERYAKIIYSESGDFKKFNVNYDIYGKTFCVTGEFDIEDREGVINRLTELGGIVKKNVIKSLDYLIIGSKGSKDYKEGTLGGKYENAVKWNARGANIAIVHEKDFIKPEEIGE